ncbi:hypothetical protein JCM8202_002924 [Rhodotorula sphaerocarpa]
MSRNDLLFDSGESQNNNLAFQTFSSTTIQPDVPQGRISPNASPHVRATNDLYATEQRLGRRLESATKAGGFLNIDSYSGWFDVDTKTVLTRCYKTLIPKEDYVADVLNGMPDLYGPIWVPSSLIFSLFLTSSLWSSVVAYLDEREYSYDFTRLGAATSVVYTYFLGLPILMWVAIKYWAGARERSPVEIVSLYGYSSTVWILVAWLALIPFSPLRIALALAATVLSFAFLARNLYPILSTAPNVSARLLIVIAAVLHVVFAAALWFGFMAGGTGALDGKELRDLPGSIGNGLGDGAAGKALRWRS